MSSLAVEMFDVCESGVVGDDAVVPCAASVFVAGVAALVGACDVGAAVDDAVLFVAWGVCHRCRLGAWRPRVGSRGWGV